MTYSAPSGACSNADSRCGRSSELSRDVRLLVFGACLVVFGVSLAPLPGPRADPSSPHVAGRPHAPFPFELADAGTPALRNEPQTTAPVVPLADTIAMLNLDMVGRRRNDKLTIYGTGTSAGRCAIIRPKTRCGSVSSSGESRLSSRSACDAHGERVHVDPDVDRRAGSAPPRTRVRHIAPGDCS